MAKFNRKPLPKNTDWALSAKGNYWRQKNGNNMVVGRKTDDDEYWALVDGRFLDAHYEYLGDAQRAAENEVP
jgi:hypothetical protein